jgi:hypothetical protein
VGRFNGLSLEGDVRLQGETLVEDWSHEDFMKLITGDGAYVHPDKVKVGVARSGGGAATVRTHRLAAAVCELAGVKLQSGRHYAAVVYSLWQSVVV